MIKVIGISFNDSKKIYYFLPNSLELNKGDNVIVETERGMQYAKVVTNIIDVDQKKLKAPLKDVVRIATEEDKRVNQNNMKLAEKALADANRFAKEENLDMKILTADFTFDKKQLLFTFLADDRIDFRNLAKKLAGIYKTRIELRQIGVRDKAREVGGYGQCGGKLCCATFLKDIDSVSINMAKNQNLALNPQKINGVCGRLMCCLSFENDNYDEYKKGLPKVGDKISDKGVKGKVIYVDIFEKMYKIETEEGKIIECKK
jgi:Uncharacterized homolog of PSP1